MELGSSVAKQLRVREIVQWGDQILKSKMRRYLNEHVNNRDLQRPDLDRRVSTTRGKVAIHIPDALHRSSVAIREQRRVLHRCAIINLENVQQERFKVTNGTFAPLSHSPP